MNLKRDLKVFEMSNHYVWANLPLTLNVNGNMRRSAQNVPKSFCSHSSPSSSKCSVCKCSVSSGKIHDLTTSLEILADIKNWIFWTFNKFSFVVICIKTNKECSYIHVFISLNHITIGTYEMGKKVNVVMSLPEIHLQTQFNHSYCSIVSVFTFM